MKINPNECRDECDLAHITLRELARFGEDLERLREEMRKAYPAEDADGHRRYHELLIEREAQRVRMRQAIIEKTLGGLLWTIMCAVGLALWQFFLSKLR